MPNKLTQIQAKSKDPIHGPWLVGLYQGAVIKTEYQCKCGNIFLVRPDSIWRGYQKSCGCIMGEKQWTGTLNISGSEFSHIKNHAKVRHQDFTITIEYLQQLWDNQNGQCSLSGLPLIYSTRKNKKLGLVQKKTASLDRIDNTKGYIPGNVQWVHKIINKMKTDLNQEEFLQYCQQISNHIKCL